jgi:hypothetical protein
MVAAGRSLYAPRTFGLCGSRLRARLSVTGAPLRRWLGQALALHGLDRLNVLTIADRLQDAAFQNYFQADSFRTLRGTFWRHAVDAFAPPSSMLLVVELGSFTKIVDSNLFVDLSP